MQWLSSLVNEYEGRPLQKTGMLSKEQLAVFFQKSAIQFSNGEFKQMLSIAHNSRGAGAAEDMINGMQHQIFESTGVQGDFGINCLSRVHEEYGDDAFFLRQFFEHVQKEEMVLDEAEMPEGAFRSKYDQLNRYRSEMEERMGKLQGMTPEEQQAYLASMYKDMIAQGKEECCSHPSGCSHRTAAEGAQGPTAEGAAEQVQVPGPPAALAPGPGGAASAMSDAEQLAFFASLNGGGAAR